MSFTPLHTPVLLVLVALPLSAAPVDDVDIPADAPDDAIMASPAECADAAAWAAAAFAGAAPPAGPARIELELRRQDHAALELGRSCIKTPLRIGSKSYARGLGTHAVSEILVRLPPGAKAFRADAGLDHNDDTRSGKGSVQFAVEIAGKEAFRSPTLRYDDEPVAVDLPLPDGTARIVLKVDATADGTGWDQADWADARVVLGDGRELRLDEAPVGRLLAATAPPFSFVYGGKPSSDLLPSWTREAETKDAGARTERRIRWTDPETKLRVTAEVVTFKRYPAVEWLLRFENGGDKDAPMLEGIQALDASLASGNVPLTLHGLHGDDCTERSFLPFARSLAPGEGHRMAPVGGRPSNGAFPFFNVERGGRGVVVAIGWSGQWAASVERDAAGRTRLRAGQERTRLVLRPGESIRTPRILLMPWTGDRLAAHNRFRRLMLFQHVPGRDGKPVVMPVFWQNYDRYRGHPVWPTEAGQIAAAKAAADCGATFLWLDAAWFPGDFPNGVGNWSAKPKEFPNGLKPVSDAAHRAGLGFILWFEPERVAPGSAIAREHPAFVHGGEQGGLYKLDDPAAHRWLADLLSSRISEYGLDWYRNDFNIDPLPFWRRNDAPDRQGMTEIRYVEGHYALWDGLIAAHPGLVVDNCASGGRRIDLETCLRSIPLWQSDTACGPGREDWDQAQMCGLNLYLPFHLSCAWSPEPYVVRSAASAGAIAQFAFLDDGFPRALAKDTLAEARENRKYWYGDFYPLTAHTTAPDQFAAWQLHRPDLDAGLVLAFRRRDCPYIGIDAKLGGLRPDATYAVEFVDEALARTSKTMTGREMMDAFPLPIANPRASLVVRYKSRP